MPSSKRRSATLVTAVAVTALGFGGAAARAADNQAAPPPQPAQQELLDQVQALRARVLQLEAGGTAPGATRPAAAGPATAGADYVDQAVADVVRDSQQRGQLLQSGGFTAGYTDGKFVIQSEDGNFLLNPNLQAQFRWVGNFRQESKNGVAQSDDFQSGFEYRRLKFSLDGNVFTKDLLYKFQWATNRTTGALELEEGWAYYKIAGTPLAVRAGQFIDPYAHEQNVSSKRQLAVDRSLLNEVISTGGVGSEWFVQGVMLAYDDGGPVRGAIAYTDGPNSRNTNFQDGAGAPVAGLGTVDYGASGRVEYKVVGNWKQYDDFTARNNKEDLLVVGGGASFAEGDNVQALFHTADVQWEPQAVPGLSVYAAYNGLYRDFRTVGAGINGSPYDWGFLAQAGYMLDKNLEVFGRYDFISLDSDAPTGTGSLGAAARVQDEIHEITVGANYYFRNHASKLTVDFTYLPNGSPLNQTGIDVLSQPSSQAQYMVRVQYQLLL